MTDFPNEHEQWKRMSRVLEEERCRWHFLLHPKKPNDDLFREIGYEIEPRIALMQLCRACDGYNTKCVKYERKETSGR